MSQHIQKYTSEATYNAGMQTQIQNFLIHLG